MESDGQSSSPTYHSISALTERWLARGRHETVDGLSLFVVEAGPERGPPILLLHGFPSWSVDYHRVLDRLATRHRVIVHDHPGFGFSSKPAEYSYSLLEQAQFALRLWHKLGVRRGHLVAHDYGTSIATELLALRERDLLPMHLTGITLSNGSVYLDLAKLRLSQRLVRSRWLGPAFGRLLYRGYFLRVMRRLWADPGAASAEDLAAIWDGVVHADGRRRAHQLAGYLDERQRFAERWHGAVRRLDLPLHVLWGRQDPVASPAIAKRLVAQAPDAKLTWLDDVGHYPMLEAPQRWAEAVLETVEKPGLFA
ncbi:MAG: alpha/beta hydrolase [Acidobacteria bacterium]|nr:alpha/beta hydrolase [Acidobacteriota bacterium]